jgi:manganese/zinc/iron transport system permease protein
MELFGLFSDFTLRTVALGAALLGVVSGCLSVFAVLRRQSLLGDTLSHAALPGVCLGFLLAGGRQLVPIMVGALLAGIAAALLVLLLVQRSRLKTDASLGIVLSVFFAIGTVLLTFIQHHRGAGQAGLDAFLFGQAASLLPGDVQVMAIASALALGLVGLLWKEFKLVTFDPDFARSLGLPVTAIEVGLTLLIAVAVVVGLQLVGVILMAAMVIAPAAAARQWSRDLGTMVVLSIIFGAVSGVVGALASASVRGLATGPVIVLCVTAFAVVSLLFAPGRGLVWAQWVGYRNRAQLRANQVLLSLNALAQEHRDPEYASEQGMLDALYGVATKSALERLEAQGMVRRASHMREEGEHWVLTPKGQHEAERLSREREP